MKIAVVGCGAVGSYYGARLCQAGLDVHFLLRSDHDAVRQNGVTVRSVEGDFHVRPGCARTPDEIGICDVVWIGLKTTANDQFPKLLPPLVGPRTTVVTLQNGLGNEEQLARLFPAEPRTHELAALLRRARVPCEITDNLARTHWEKLVWNIPFNGLGVAGAAGYEALTSAEC